MNRIHWETTMRNWLITIVVLTIFFPISLHAEEYTYIYKGVRPMGMGGAFVAVSNDANALFYNPAGLADITETKASILSLELEIGQGAYDMYSDSSDTDFDDEAQTADFLRKYIGEYSHVSLAAFPNYAKPNFALGILGAARTNLQAHNRQYPKLQADGITDMGVCLGYAHSIYTEDILIGVSGKFVSRKSLDREYTVLDLINDDFNGMLEDDMEEGIGILFDAGILYKMKDVHIAGEYIDLNIGLCGNNLGMNDFDDAKDMNEHVDLGFAAMIKSWRVALDFIDLTKQIKADEDLAKRVRLGVEYSVTRRLFLRGGLYQGYTTLGVGLDTKHATFDLLTYAEEVGAYGGQRSDRRYLGRVSIGF